MEDLMNEAKNIINSNLLWRIVWTNCYKWQNEQKKNYKNYTYKCKIKNCVIIIVK